MKKRANSGTSGREALREKERERERERERGARTGLVKYKQLSFVEGEPTSLGGQLPRNLVK